MVRTLANFYDHAILVLLLRKYSELRRKIQVEITCIVGAIILRTLANLFSCEFILIALDTIARARKRFQCFSGSVLSDLKVEWARR